MPSATAIVGASLDLTHGKACGVKAASKLLTWRRRPYGKQTVGTKCFAGGIKASQIVESIVRLAAEAVWPVVYVEQDCVESRASRCYQIANIAVVKADPRVAKAIGGKVGHGATCPFDDRGGQLCDQNPRIGVKSGQSGA